MADRIKRTSIDTGKGSRFVVRSAEGKRAEFRNGRSHREIARVSKTYAKAAREYAKRAGQQDQA